MEVLALTVVWLRNEVFFSVGASDSVFAHAALLYAL